jgi:DNA (cytosine-5)-methyltransferase 1
MNNSEKTLHTHDLQKQLSFYLTNADQNTFIDLFAGCGGLSLGLLASGWNGLFAIEKNEDAFKTLCHNLIVTGHHNQYRSLYNWPSWITRKPHDIHFFINEYRDKLHELNGSVKLVAGGPPCQGFSFAGKRNENDARNELFRQHLEIVDIIKPEFVLLENVQGIDSAFGTSKSRSKSNGGSKCDSYARRIRGELDRLGYYVQQELIMAADFGVPQLRIRCFTVGIRKNLFSEKHIPSFFNILHEIRPDFLKARGLPVDRYITAAEAISDLETVEKHIKDCIDPESRLGYKEISYDNPITHYQKLMHGNQEGRAINSLRLVNHRQETINRFKEIHRTCRKGVTLSSKDRERLGIRKTAVVPLAPDLPSHTLTTIPDDILHYSEPRVHTVREYARFQSFPDWFEFRGKYTTGGHRRAHECPRYTQVGNAVPPLLAEAIGEAFNAIIQMHKNQMLLECYEVVLSYGVVKNATY